MQRLRHSRPSPGLVVAIAALVAALAGTAVAADPVATTARLDKKEKKQAKKIARKQIRKLAPGLSVDHANTADSATNAENADNATNAQNAENANTANTANSADTANNANNLGGQPPDAYEPAKQWILVASNGVTRLAGSSGVTVEPGSSGTFSYVDFGRSVANRLILATSNRPLAGEQDISATPCGGAAAAPGASTCVIGNDVNHVLVRKAPAGQPFYLAVF
jgi:hypothetical protein